MSSGRIVARKWCIRFNNNTREHLNFFNSDSMENSLFCVQKLLGIRKRLLKISFYPTGLTKSSTSLVLASVILMGCTGEPSTSELVNPAAEDSEVSQVNLVTLRAGPNQILLYRNRNSDSSTNLIEGQFLLVNEGTEAYDFSRTEVRYFLTPDGLTPEVSVKRTSPLSLKDEINAFYNDSGNHASFTMGNGADFIVGPGQHIMVRYEITSQSGTEFLQSDDPSFIAGQDDYGRNAEMEFIEAGDTDTGDTDTGGAGTSAVIAYSPVPDAQPSQNYQLQVNNVDISIEDVFADAAIAVTPNAEKYRIAVARLAYDFSIFPTATLDVQVNENISNYTISPQNPSRFGIGGSPYYTNISANNSRLRFDIDEPRKIFIAINDLDYLVIFIDPKETNIPSINDANVLNIADYLNPDRNRNSNITNEVQQALNDASSQSKTLFIGDGLYRTGQLNLKSNTHLYLASGAKLQAVSDWNRTIWPEQANANATNDDSSFIFIGDNNVNAQNQFNTKVRNVKITGRGTIDGNGYNLRTLNDSTNLVANVKLLRAANVEGLDVNDVYFRDSARWSFHLLATDDATFRNTKLINNIAGDIDLDRGFHVPIVTNTDGFDIDASSNILLDDNFVFTGDDAFTPKVTGYMGLQSTSHHITIQNNIIWSMKVALKVGSPMKEDIRQVVYKDNKIIRTDRFVSLLAEVNDHVTIEDLDITDNTIEEIGMNSKRRYFRFRIRGVGSCTDNINACNGSGSIHNIVINGLAGLKFSKDYSSSEGYDQQNAITNVEIDNFSVDGNQVSFDDVFKPLANGDYLNFIYSSWKFNNQQHVGGN